MEWSSLGCRVGIRSLACDTLLSELRRTLGATAHPVLRHTLSYAASFLSFIFYSEEYRVLLKSEAEPFLACYLTLALFNNLLPIQQDPEMRQDWVTESLSNGSSMNWALILWSCPLLNLLNSAKMPWKGSESFLIQRLHAYSYREDVKLSHLPRSPTQMGLGPFGLPCKGTPWSLEQVTILNENNKTSLSNLYSRTLSGLRPLRSPFLFTCRTLWHPYLWAMFISECSGAKL